MFKAQSLLELLVAMSIGTILIGGSTTLIGLSLNTFRKVRDNLQANSLIRQTAEVVISLARDNWHNIYDLSKGSNYYATSTNNVWSFVSGQETSTINSVSYQRWFQVSNVNRDTSGNIATTGTNDPSTQKITIFLNYGPNYLSSSSLSFYLTRSYDNQVFWQTDWSGGSGQTGPVPDSGNKFDTAESNINYASSSGSLFMTIPTTTSSYLLSSILDTGIENGAGFNSLLWQGSTAEGDTVRFQIAFSNCSNGASNPPTCNSGTWTYYGPTSTSDYYQMNPGVSVMFPTSGISSPQNYRYFRYKLYLSTSRASSPVVDDIIINWSP